MSKRPGDSGYAPGWCIHYRAASEHDTCEAGVAYETFRKDNFKASFATQPCFLTKNGKSKEGACHCEHLRLPTPEEIALHKEYLKNRMEMYCIVQTAIAPWRKKHQGKSAQEIIECPKCKGKLHLSIAAYNGHVHGHCETKGCVSWME